MGERENLVSLEIQDDGWLPSWKLLYCPSAIFQWNIIRFWWNFVCWSKL